MVPVLLAPPPCAHAGTAAANANDNVSADRNQRFMLILLQGRPATGVRALNTTPRLPARSRAGCEIQTKKHPETSDSRAHITESTGNVAGHPQPRPSLESRGECSRIREEMQRIGLNAWV